MARDGLFTLVCAGALGAGILHLPFTAAQGRETPITVTLAVQTALQQGRDCLLRGNNAQAVQVLEAQLARINGSREYLGVLRDAYRGHIKELRLARKDAEAEELLKRLKVLDPVAAAEPAVAHAVPASAGAPSKPTTPEPVKPPLTARGKSDEDQRPDAVHPTTLPAASSAPSEPSVLDQAEREFAVKHYEAAGKLFEKASLAGLSLAVESKERWAYCKLYSVVAVLNQATKDGPAGTDLEREVQLALCLAPRLKDYGQELLNKIHERRSGTVTPAGPAEGGLLPAKPGPVVNANVTVRHLDQKVENWSVAETTNFRILHNQQRDLAEKAAQAAENARLTMSTKWLGEAGADWQPRCDVFLHATAQDYSRQTGVPANSPGHSTIRSESGRVVGRRIDLHCDDVNMLTAVLPHEATHVVLAGRFGEFPVPRWADEGVAVLSEPRDKVERHLRNLPQYRQDQTLLGVREIVQMSDYPNPRFISAFYAQSVSLVEFLTREKGSQIFSAFVRDGLTGGYEAAMKKHYGFQNFDELEQRWRRHAFGDSGANSASKR